MAYSSDRRGPVVRKDQKFNVPSNSRGRVYHSTPTKQGSRTRPGVLQGSVVTTAAAFDTSLSSIQTDHTQQPSSAEDLKLPDKLSSQLEMLSQTLNGSRKTEEEIGLIYKQQHELQLLMAELRDRDKELNETVTAHRKQLDAWDADRRKMLILEERYVKCKKDLRSKDGYISHLELRLKSLEEREHSHSQELETTQVELQQAHMQTDHASKEFQKLKSHQQALQKSIRILKEREESLNKDLLSRNNEIAEKIDMSFKLEKTCAELEGKLKVSERAEELLKQEVAAQRALIADSRQEQEKLKAQNELYVQDVVSVKEELSRIRERCAILEKELQLAGERDQRKEQLLSLQRMKQQRCDTELANIRQLYDRQQRELELLRLNLSSTQEQMVKQEEELSLHRHSSPMSTPEKSPDHQRKSPLVRNSYSRVSTGSPGKYQHGESELPGVSTATVQHELGQLATGIRDKLATIFQSDSPPLQVDDVDEETIDVDDASSVVSFPELPAVSGTDLDSSSRLQKLLTESENLARQINASQRHQENGSST